jgi:putative phosphoesterase
MPILTVGLLSDTHIPYRVARLPEGVLKALEGVDLILHAGDVDDPTRLMPLRQIAPVYAVRGNYHLLDLSDGGAALPALVTMDLAGYRVVLTHGHVPGLLGYVVKVRDIVAQSLFGADNEYLNDYTVPRLARRYPDADVIVFGHTHRARVERVGRVLIVNPGAVCPGEGDPKTVARMRLGDGPPTVEIVPLPN